jgi:tRNA-dihydrouridine synthase 4
MAARGILENPALFAKHTEVPVECLRDLLAWAIRCPIPFTLVLHHVTEMTARMPGMTKRERKAMMQCADLLDLLDFVEQRWPTLDEEKAAGEVQVAGLKVEETACP